MFYILLTCWLGILQASLLKKDFTDMDLIVVPPIEAEIPLDTTILVLNKNKISAILPHTFNGLSRLDSLSLGYNLLTVFPNLSSVALTLESLSLNNNLITTIEAAHLEVLTRLKDLNLHVNHLAEIPDVALPALTTLYLSKNEFYHFPSLEQLGKSLAYINIHENFINYISVVSLQYLVSVEKLYVHGNQLKTAPVFCYSTTSTLTFKIRDNPVECDQRIGWLLTEGISPQGQCESPGHLKGKELDTLSYSELGVTRGEYIESDTKKMYKVCFQLKIVVLCLSWQSKLQRKTIKVSLSSLQWLCFIFALNIF